MEAEAEAARTQSPPIPRDVVDVLRVLEAWGFQAYIVGGAVRDLLLGRAPGDYDVATSARPGQVLKLFSSMGWRVVPKGVRYGVVSVVHPATGREVEVATFRREFYPLDYRRREAVVEYADSVEEDLARRDFTVNAMAMDRFGRIVDPYGGVRDLRARILRFVGDPYERIREDPLRMLRLARLAAQLGFRVDPAAARAVRERAGALAEVSAERVGDEVVKAMRGAESWRFPLLLLGLGLHRVVLPELEDMARVRHDSRPPHRGETVLEHTAEAMRRAAQARAPPRLVLAVMLHDIGKPRTVVETGGRVSFPGHEEVGAELARRILLERWRRSRRLADYVYAIVRYHMAPLHMVEALGPRRAAARLASRYGEYAGDLLLHAYADTGNTLFLEALELLRQRTRQQPRPLLTGHDIMRLYKVPPGPRVGELKQRLYELQLEKGITSREELLEEACRQGICPK